MSDMKSVANTPNFEIFLNPERTYGYFEHHDEGDNHAGGLWFENGSLTDYDGVFELPKEVMEKLVALGFKVDEEFWE